MMDFSYKCTDCGNTYDSSEIRYLCSDCQAKQEPDSFQRGVLMTLLDPDYLKKISTERELPPELLLPYKIPAPGAYPVGDTPLLGPVNIRKKTGFSNLFFKNDGSNPSGSLKDRASRLVAAQAFYWGEPVVTLASTGNAGSAMACAGAAYGLDVVLFVPETAPKAKLMQSVLYGARVIPVKGTYDDAFGLSIEYTKKIGGINRNTAYNPMTIEGKKTVSIEIYNHFGGKSPDAVYVPTGDGVILGGVYKGFFDLREAGLIEKLPKIICVQAEGSNAISRALDSGDMNNLETAATIADSISVASPANGRMAVDCIKTSGGWSVEVRDEEIIRAQLELCRDAGVFVEPAAAAAYAGFLKDRDSLDADENVVVLLTGIGFKDMKSVEGEVEIPKAIAPSLKNIID